MVKRRIEEVSARRSRPRNRGASLSLVLALIGAGLVACSPPDQEAVDEGADAAVLADLSRQAEDMMVAVRTRDVARVATYYDTTGSFVHFENGRQTTWPVLSQQMHQFLGSAARVDLFWVGAPQIVILAPDAALIHGVHSFEGSLKDGTVQPRHTGLWTGVLRRIDGQWKLVHSHSSEPRG